MVYKVILANNHNEIVEYGSFENISETSDYIESLLGKLDLGFEIRAYEKLGEEWKLIRSLRKRETN